MTQAVLDQPGVELLDRDPAGDGKQIFFFSAEESFLLDCAGGVGGVAQVHLVEHGHHLDVQDESSAEDQPFHSLLED